MVGKPCFYIDFMLLMSIAAVKMVITFHSIEQFSFAPFALDMADQLDSHPDLLGTKKKRGVYGLRKVVFIEAPLTY